MDITQLAIGDFFLQSVRASAFNLMSAKGSGLNLAVSDFISIGLLVAVTIKGILIMGGNLVGNAKSIFKMAVWALVAIGITTPSIYQSMVILPIIELRDNLSIYFVSNDGYRHESLFEAISGSFNYMFHYAFKIMADGGWRNPTPIIAGIAMGLVYGVYYVAIVLNLVLCEVILSFLFLMGLLIIPLSTFETLRGMLKSWLTLILQYSLVVICSSVFISILNNISMMAVENLIKIKGVEGITSPWIGLALITACFGIVIMKVAFDVSAHLSGGMMGAGNDGMNSVKSSMGNVAGTLRAADTIRKRFVKNN